MAAPTGFPVLEHLVYSVFLPPKLPQEEQDETSQSSVDLSIIHSVIQAGDEYMKRSGASSQWNRVRLGLQQLSQQVEDSLDKTQLYQAIKGMRVEDFIPLYIRAQNTGLIIQRQIDHMSFEVFEVQAQANDVMSVPGKIVRHFPGPVVQVPISVARDEGFIKEVSSILAQTNRDIFENAHPKTRKAGMNVRESRDSIHPNYFIQYFFGFLRGFGTTFDPPRITKRLGDEVLWKDAKNPWRRSPIWLIIRVTLQTSLDSKITYKHFMVYHHAHILSQCFIEASFSSDLLYAMKVKVARRIYKVKDTAQQFLVDAVKAAMHGTQKILQERWDAIQNQARAPNREFSGSESESAINQTLPNSYQYLQEVFEGRSGDGNPLAFDEPCSPRLESVIEFSQYAKNALTEAYKKDPHLALFDFETVVINSLPQWITNSKRQNPSTACVILYSCFRQYITAARSYYATDVAGQSIMILTLMRIWMAIDELATTACPLLSRFSPELPDNILDSILLRTTLHLEQARIIQQYIRGRHDGTSARNPSIFSDKIVPQSFAVQYFENSPHHHQLMEDIEKYALEKKSEKIQELERLNARHKQLSEEIEGMTHDFYEKSRGKQQHSELCGRCLKEKEKKGLGIEAYEWPLPRHKPASKAVVFELDRPKSFVIWRDITYEILVDLGALSPRPGCDRHATLEEYGSLAQWLVTPDSSEITPRIIVASVTKSFKRSHYKYTRSIPTTESQVCLNNPLLFKFYDKDGDTWASEPFSSASFAKFGTFELPAGSPYYYLNHTLQKTTHTSNEVLAMQSDCPKELNLHEHIAFGTLRSGALLQWMNIIRGLEEDLLTFSSDEVRLLHTQAAWQIGPLLNDGSREWHKELSSSEFGCLLISLCKRVLNRVKANWLHANSVLTIVMLVSRLLAALPPGDVVQEACNFLRDSREVAQRWLNDLETKLKAACREDVISFQYRVCEMAAICRATYDVEPHVMQKLLSRPDDYATLVECAIRLHDNQPPDIQKVPKSLQDLLSRDRRLAHKIEPYIMTAVRGGIDIFSNPISKIWPGYRQGSTGWQILQAPQSRWVTTTASSTSDERVQDIHLNILTGHLLVAGRPVGRLPRYYVEHPTYTRLFGQKILDVIPAKYPGMRFSTRDLVHGYEVSFIVKKKELFVQARKDDRVYQLIPHEKLSRDFPVFFSENYHHWADVYNKTVEFRPLSNPWSAEECEWCLRLDDEFEVNTLKNPKKDTLVIDIHSTLFKSLSFSLGPLESNQYLHVTRSVEGLVEAELPRMKLSFFINEDNQLESRNFRGQVLDENQSAGTLFGLKNQLLLRAKKTFDQSLPRSRSLLIPDGVVNYDTDGHHVSVSIQSDSLRNVDIYHYKIDDDLNYLVTDAGLTSRLFKIHLHALTSHCLPDPLTGHTGTEEALYELSQASTSSFEQINPKQAELLKVIGLLTPKRHYYPLHLQSMQTTYWRSLPSLSQHFAFSFAAGAVLRRADTLQLFHPVDFPLKQYLAELDTNSDILLKRATRRTAAYYNTDLSKYASHILDPAALSDSILPGRDSLVGDWEKEGQVASWASAMTHRTWGKSIFMPCDLVSMAEAWGTLKDQGKNTTLSYDPTWFNLSLDSSWISFYNLLRQCGTSRNSYSLSACLASIAFGKTSSKEPELIPVFLAFAMNPEFRAQGMDPPAQRLFRFEDKYEPTVERVDKIAEKYAYPVGSSPAGELVRDKDEPDLAFRRRKEKDYNHHLSECKLQIVNSLMSQWPHMRRQPSIRLQLTSSYCSKWFDLESCLKAANEYFSSCVWNIQMKRHLQNLEVVLASGPTSVGVTFAPIDSDKKQVHTNLTSKGFSNPWGEFDITSLMRSRPAPHPTEISLLPKFSLSKRTRPATDSSRLTNLLSEFQQNQNSLNRRYGNDLDESRIKFDEQSSVSLSQQFSPSTLARLDLARDHCVEYLSTSYEQLKSALSPRTDIEESIFLAGVWPRITPRTLLHQLSLKNRTLLSPDSRWMDELIGYAQAFTGYQKSQRLIALAESDNTEEFYKELDLSSSEEDPGINNPDWLLVQIDGNFGARAVQRRVAHEMMSPSSGSNTILQLNMGEGKSSVIVPIIASALANSSRLVRVVVLKPLWRQMFELLVHRLSGLSNRRIYYLPFGRHINIDGSSAHKLQNLYEECMREGGILLVQPEHILSFKLMGIDRLISSTSPSEAKAANSLWDMQQWLMTHSRDILDESDEILHVRYQLVYTVGEQQLLDDHPDRWTTAQHVFQLAAEHIKDLQAEYPDSFSYKHMDCGQFPTIRILPDSRTEHEKKLISTIATAVLDGEVPNLSLNRLSFPVKKALLEFFTENDLPYEKYEFIRGSCDPTIWKSLLLVRGLLASGILIFVLKRKYYRVDYGLHRSRSLLAVPYRAKDMPSLRAEFGHPDVAVALTCLSYYYHGLTEEDLDLCFKLLFKLDNPPLEYGQWVEQNEAIPNDLKELNGVNIKDEEQFIGRIYPNFSRNSATIDFFLSYVVFPKAAKSFSQKLSVSGWDLVQKKQHITTGFSGTNDNRYLLPTSITQADPVKQLSTNALVLSYLLRSENNCYICMRDEKNRSLTTKKFLKLLVVQKPAIGVLLDVGAQMLEMKNEELVRCWLDLRPDVEAAVYFNDMDELVVLPQNGTPVHLNSSPFAQHLDKCIVYLDDGHTRGTDLRLPRNTRALVTLGPKVTKDRLLQGCMRMRKLGHGQLVVFAAPPEIDTQIRSASPKPISSSAAVDALDVLRWSMLETCKDLQHHVHHWAQQGIEFDRRREAEEGYGKTRDVAVIKRGWITPESRPLEEMYGVLSPMALCHKASSTRRAFEVPEIRRGLDNLGIGRLEDPSMDEEQEREVQHEVEREQQHQRPPKREPAKHSIHPGVEHFITTGTLPDPGQAGIVRLFHAFKSSNPEIYNGWSPLLFASSDFLQTVAQSRTDQLNEYMRPVNWIITGHADIRVVISPQEVNKLLPLIRNSSVVRLHIYAPRVSRSMLSFSNLQFYSIPPVPKSLTRTGSLSTAQLHLDLFAGQLYFSCYQDYASLCASLGLFVRLRDEDPNVEIGTDGFISPEHRVQLVDRRPEYFDCRFTATPVPALKEFIGLRRKGMKYDLTHVGQIIHSRDLTPEDF
ncbi:unnamed protein product [Rhizoctonia solani]|uniref:ubiquitinyl hydrolase 1 n=1 Tax=Rhizoctonia solani TaxID=456999 RepID=A0A8H3CSZ4_9AGAM|nr:unnamed protein product [Rhizoctonia solani]